MTDHRRDGNHPNDWSRNRRTISSGGVIPDAWNATLIDLDGFVMISDGKLELVNTESKIWLPYEYVPVERQVEIVGLFEHKRPGEEKGSLVSQRLAALADLPWWLLRSLGEKVDGEDQFELSNNRGMFPLKGDAAAIVQATEMATRHALRKKAAKV